MGVNSCSSTQQQQPQTPGPDHYSTTNYNTQSIVRISDLIHTNTNMRSIAVVLFFVLAALAVASAFPFNQYGSHGHVGFQQGVGGFQQGFGGFQQPIEFNAAGLPCEKFCRNSFSGQYQCCETLQNT